MQPPSGPDKHVQRLQTLRSLQRRDGLPALLEKGDHFMYRHKHSSVCT